MKVLIDSDLYWNTHFSEASSRVYYNMMLSTFGLQYFGISDDFHHLFEVVDGKQFQLFMLKFSQYILE